jgi:Putative Ig domain
VRQPMNTGHPLRRPAGRTRLAMTMAALLAGITLCGVATAVPALATTPAPLAVATTYLPPGTANTSYSAQLAATGGTKPYDWTISAGALPTGLTLHPTTGAITGKPTVTGPASFTVSVTDSESTPVTTSATESITVTAPPLTVTTTSLPTATADAAYKATLAATGGVALYTWLLNGGALPDGLTLHTNGTVSGTPKVAGTFSFTAEVADSDSPTETASASLSITVAAAPLVITTDSMLPSAQAGTPYSVKLSADGGITPYTWSVVSGALPYGVTLHSNGTISGTPTGDGTFSITVQVTDSESPTASADQVFTLVVPAPLAVTTTSLPGGTVGETYSARLSATGGVTPYTWSLASGSLPPGLTVNPSGTVSGTVGGSPGTYTATVEVTDSENPAATATETYTISIAAPSLAITTTSLPGADEGATYSATLSATGGVGPYTWTVTSGFLPDGLTLDTSTGVIGGTVLRGSGPYTVTIEVSDSENPAATSEQTFTLDVIPSPVPIILTQGPLTAVATTPYSQTLEATGGVPPYTWSVVSGSLPTGLSLDSSTGAISGTPQDQGTDNFTIQAADSGNPPATADQAYTMTVTLPPLAITTTSLPTAVTGNYNSATLTATGGLAPYTWTLASGSSLPPGLTLDSSAGTISGTPTTAGSYTFTIQTADSENPPATITQAYTLVVAPHVAITTTTLPDGALNTDYLATLTATGGVAPYTWTLAIGSSLPPGLTLNSSTGVLGGIPTAPEVYTFTIRATDSDNPLSPESAVQTYTIVVSG